MSLESTIVGQANHGVCAVAMDPWAAYEHIERLDHICEIVLKSDVVARATNQQPSAENTRKTASQDAQNGCHNEARPNPDIRRSTDVA